MPPRVDLACLQTGISGVLFWVLNFGNLYFLYVSILFLRKLVGIPIKDDFGKCLGECPVESRQTFGDTYLHMFTVLLKAFHSLRIFVKHVEKLIPMVCENPDPIWTGPFANLKRLGRGGWPPFLPGYFKSDDDET